LNEEEMVTGCQRIANMICNTGKYLSNWLCSTSVVENNDDGDDSVLQLFETKRFIRKRK